MVSSRRRAWQSALASVWISAACGGDDSAAAVTLLAENDAAVARFEVQVDSSLAKITVTAIGPRNALFGPIDEGGGVDTASVRGSNVRIDGACPGGFSNVICFDFSVNSFFDTETLSNTWVTLTSLTPSTGFEPVNATTVGIPTLIQGHVAQWSYGDIGPELSCGGSSATATWVFNRGAGNFSFRGAIYADPIPTAPDVCNEELCSCDTCQCDQSCNGTNCDFECKNGACDFGQVFESAACTDSSCNVTCDSFAQSCDLTCSGASACDYQCPTGYCDTDCQGTSQCDMTCGSVLSFFDRFFLGLEACELECAAGAQCLLECNGSPGCSAEDLTCLGVNDLQDCGGGVYACHRECP